MAKKKIKPFYKNWWIYAIAIIIVLVVVVWDDLDRQENYEDVEAEYNEIYFPLEELTNEIMDIETKYSRNEIVYYYEFSESDIEDYIILLNQLGDSYDDLIFWTISNEKYLKSQGKSDLAISESIKELRATKEKIEEVRLQAALVQNF